MKSTRASLSVVPVLILAVSLLSGCFRGGPLDGDGAYSTHAAVGDSAFDLLSDADFGRLVVEVQPVEGYEPRQAALDNLKSFIEARVHKPAGVSVVVNSPIASPGHGSYSISDIRAIEDRTRTRFPEGSTLTASKIFNRTAGADSKHLAFRSEALRSGKVHGKICCLLARRPVVLKWIHG